MQSSKRFFCFLMLLGLAYLPLPVHAQSEPSAPRQIIRIATSSGDSVEIDARFAVTPAQKSQGLMHVTFLAPMHGMMFVMNPPEVAHFWMRNTRLPLDMIFIAPGGRIASIVTRRDTQSDAISTSGTPVEAVLEIAAGASKALGIQPGDTVFYARDAF
ncbi:DUF192 domain-containing protein [Alphaproteobacteria bacterium]|nr:DUF192 domain-containing protein [Alphaproteobacteria bacterium]